MINCRHQLLKILNWLPFLLLRAMFGGCCIRAAAKRVSLLDYLPLWPSSRKYPIVLLGSSVASARVCRQNMQSLERAGDRKRSRSRAFIWLDYYGFPKQLAGAARFPSRGSSLKFH